ncbi:prephenate dehydrogenase [Neisseria sp. Ec49-e6-T10]|uniref:prephenate dehydrogenase n=1 Tax=Neisseria sp. Ec49-e6-T10 TaxID=3140744 RepID=UPI003EBD0B2C
MKLENLVLIGVGLIGGSFALDLKRSGQLQHVHGIDINPDNLERAIERNVIDTGSTTLAQDYIANADLILMATPIGQFAPILQQLNPLLKTGTIITDVGSTKREVIAAFKTHLPEHFHHYIATHPIAGSDRSGAISAQFGLFKDKKVILCPHEAQNEEAFHLINTLWQSIGATTFVLTPQEHDQVFASVSHLPHLLSFAFIHQIINQHSADQNLFFAGTGFQDFTRIASSDPSVWTDICLANQDILIDLIEQNQQELNQISHYLKQADKKALFDYFAQAKQSRDQWLTNK